MISKHKENLYSRVKGLDAAMELSGSIAINVPGSNWRSVSSNFWRDIFLFQTMEPSIIQTQTWNTDLAISIPTALIVLMWFTPVENADSKSMALATSGRTSITSLQFHIYHLEQGDEKVSEFYAIWSGDVKEDSVRGVLTHTHNVVSDNISEEASERKWRLWAVSLLRQIICCEPIIQCNCRRIGGERSGGHRIR